MYIEVIKSKIHRVTVTRANLDYIGSITVDRSLMEAAGLFEGEKVSVVNVTNGNRVETYVIPGEEGSGSIELNGAAAHLFAAGDIVRPGPSVPKWFFRTRALTNSSCKCRHGSR